MESNKAQTINESKINLSLEACKINSDNKNNIRDDKAEKETKEKISDKYSVAIDKKIKIISISGKFGSGKDYMRGIIVSILARLKILCVPISFADHFKVECCGKDHMPYEKVFGSQRDDKTRQALQRRGTEEGIQIYGKYIWVDIIGTWIRIYSERGIEYFCIADTRFTHEIEWLKDQSAVIIRLVAPRRTWDRALIEAKGDVERANVLMNHISETALDNPKYNNMFDLILDNDYGKEIEATEIITKFIMSKFSKCD